MEKQREQPYFRNILKGMENLFSVLYLWVYTSQRVDKAGSSSNQPSCCWF